MIGDYEIRAEKIPRGPWFRSWYAEKDGLEVFYIRKTAGAREILLSNNMTWQDREAMQHMYLSARRNNLLCQAFSLWAGFELYSHVINHRIVAIPRLLLSGLGAFLTYYFTSKSTGQKYRPQMHAFFNKYQDQVKKDFFDIQDRKREWFDIDTSVPTAYSSQEVAEQGYHMHHGPQPVSTCSQQDGEVFNNSWLQEMDKFLKSEPNSFKSHRFFLDYKFDSYDRKVPTKQDVEDLFSRPAASPRAHRSNLAQI